MLVSSLWKSGVISIEYLMAHFESSSYSLSAFPKKDQMEEPEKSKKSSFGGACCGNENLQIFLSGGEQKPLSSRGRNPS